jgi:tRNA modification GTPase
LQGMLGERARHWRARIIDASALIEAGIDFSDEGDVSAELVAPAVAKIRVLLEEIEEVLAAQGQSERLRDGLVVAIAGAPNVGKSTLMNQLARREVAIVSPHAGTTRDVIEVQLDLDGYPVMLIDTAGIREADDPVEQEGVRRARARAADADLVLWLADGDSAGAALGGAVPVWTVRTKIDLEPRQPDAAGFDFRISASQGDGLRELIASLVGFAGDYFGAEEGGLIGRERHRRLLRETADLLRRSISVIDEGEEFTAEDLRAAADCLGRLLGRVDVEDILDKIFRDFCIGK